MFRGAAVEHGGHPALSIAGLTQIGMRRGYYQAEGGREDAVVLRRSLGKGRA
jgi:hypothetical protein